MCGICGLIHTDPSIAVDTARLDAMNAALIHRGPDDGGRWTRRNVGLAARRLSIRDLAHGRQPMANDLRMVLSSIKIAAALERIADYAKNTAKRGIVMTQGTAPASAVAGIDRLGKLVRTALKDVLDAFADGDVAKAHDVWNRDEEIDQVYTGLFRELLTYMMEDPRTITACTHLLFMAKNIERAGDHVTNISENVYFIVTGSLPQQDRIKLDTSSTIKAPPGTP